MGVQAGQREVSAGAQMMALMTSPLTGAGSIDARPIVENLRSHLSVDLC